ncbi:MAG: tetratricopeptide repeat protein [candidate division WOR-3 bacterium]
MELIPAAALSLVAAIAAGTAVYLFVRTRRQWKLLWIEARLYRLEKDSNREASGRLRIMQRRTGVLYFDGLTYSTSRGIARPFRDGLEHASHGQWDRASCEWTEAHKLASGSEAVALEFLIACCLLMSNRVEAARTTLVSALKHSRRLRDRAGMASCCFVLGRLEREERRYAASHSHFLASSRLWDSLGDLELEARALAEAAEVAGLMGMWQRSLRLHRQSLRLSEENEDKVSAAARYAAIGTIMVQQGEFDKARAAHEDGLHLARQAGDRLAEAEHLLAIAEIHLLQASPKRALEVLERSLRLYRNVRHPAGQARALLRIALIHQRLGDVNAAMEHSEQALRLSRGIGDRQLVAQALEGVAEGMMAHGAHEQAEALLEEAVALDREIGDATRLARHLVALGRALLAQREDTKAEEVLREAVSFSRKAVDQRTELWAAVELSRVLRKQARTDEAMKLLVHYRSLNVTDLEVGARLRTEIGLCFLALNDSDRAVAELRQASQLWPPGFSRERGAALVELGRALVASNESAAGIRSIEEGLHLLRESGHRSDESWALRVLAEVNRQQGNPELARHNLARALELARQEQDTLAEAESLVALGRLAAAQQDYGQAKSSLELALRTFVRTGLESRANELADELRRLPHAGVGVRFLDETSGIDLKDRSD